jgi:pimeloyl-ACP methyl ester carboxylesterase
VVLFCLVLSGCSLTPNPSIRTSYQDAKALLAEMRDQPKPGQNPIIVLGGWRDPGLVAWRMHCALKGVVTSDTPIFRLAFGLATSFEQIREEVIALVDRELPSSDPEWTTAVDVVGFSMGGLVARYAAAPNGGSRRLRIDRLFTIAAPHRGARSAFLMFFDPLARDMRPGSEFLLRLDEALETASYQIIPYTRLSDPIVGEANASPPNQTPLWVPARPFQTSHLFSAFDARIRADIMRRLRGEKSLFTEPLAPLPSP